ncbi:MAG: hypothetical protein L3J34_02435 [Flavobacteriaceae bacterium]|nr:hypothetical protein [Flavobacteriaceae bacterium]
MVRNKVIPLNSKNYSEMLKDFSDKFLKEFPKEIDTLGILDFSLEAWNTANLNKLIPNYALENIGSSFDDADELSLLFEKMLAYKEKHYGIFE